jgi:hypothetical protein
MPINGLYLLAMRVKNILIFNESFYYNLFGSGLSRLGMRIRNFWLSASICGALAIGCTIPGLPTG